MSTLPLERPQIWLSVILATTRMRLITVTRYPGMLLMDVVTPIIIAAMPILLGRATGGENAGEIFAANTGTSNYVAYMLLGSTVFTIVSFAFWHVAYWLRWEMETGTLESLYMTPTNRIWVAAGIALYSMIRSIVAGGVAYVAGSYIMGVNPFQGELLLASVFLLVGMIPLFGMTLLFGAVILKIKEANAIISLMQWVVSFLMGIYFPVTVLPPLVRFFALLFPPTWMTNGVRSAILGVGYFFGEWYLDLAVLGVFLMVAPLLGYFVFSKVETGVRRNEGVGQY